VSEPLLEGELAVRVIAFAGVLAAMMVWERAAPRRRLRCPRLRRWGANLALAGLNAGLLRVLSPAALVGVAAWAEQGGWGTLRALDAPVIVALPLSVVVLDGVVYLQHVLLHAVPALWRLHLVHHADQDFDATTGLRFHPIEVLVSFAIKGAGVLALGAPALAVLAFEVLLNATSLFNHGNVRLPAALDRVLRWIVVTPDMHRVHHSVEVRETNSNFGFNLPWWDRLLGTYRASPRAGHEGMTIGIEQRQSGAPDGLVELIAMPFATAPGEYPLWRS
jgi:sterol desaturase/sphingolipid hydroxylase (fatty acid hydroxylase superfamily)